MSWCLIKNKKNLGFFSKDLSDKYIVFSKYINELEYKNNHVCIKSLVTKLNGVSLI
jgi:hypothetical protein